MSAPLTLTWILTTLMAGASPAYRIETAPVQRVEATLSFEIRTPSLTAEDWEIFVAKIPELPGQSKVASKLEPPGKEIKEASPLHRLMLTARIKAETKDLKKGIKIQVNHEALLKSRRLVLSAGTGTTAGAPGLTKEERAAALGGSSQYDFQAKPFQDWLNAHSLRRRKGEDTIAFAHRVYQAITDNFTYQYKSEMDREASKVCQSEGSDCGGLSILFVSALRANGVPARILVGRWAQSAEKGQKLGGIAYLQTHVKAEFHADHVGWIPVDASLGVKEKTAAGKLRYFGQDEGDFLVFHVDPDLIFNTTRFGKKTEAFLQGVSYWVTGSGSLADKTMREEWQVRQHRLNQPTRQGRAPRTLP